MSRLIVTDGQIEDTSGVRLQEPYLVSRSRFPVCSNYPSVGCAEGGGGGGGGGTVEVNWLEWIVLRCEPKTDTDGNMAEVEVMVVVVVVGDG